MYCSNKKSCHFGFSDDVRSLFHLTVMGCHSLHLTVPQPTESTAHSPDSSGDK